MCSSVCLAWEVLHIALMTATAVPNGLPITAVQITFVEVSALTAARTIANVVLGKVVVLMAIVEVSALTAARAICNAELGNNAVVMATVLHTARTIGLVVRSRVL